MTDSELAVNQPEREPKHSDGSLMTNTNPPKIISSGERLHPDRLPVESTPDTDAQRKAGIQVGEYQEPMELRARTAEADKADLEKELAEAKRVIAWLRAGPWEAYPNAHRTGPDEWFPHGGDFRDHLASNPPEDWEP